MKRKHPLKTGDIHHVVNKSIAGYEIFNSNSDFERMIKMLLYFSYKTGSLPKFSEFNSSALVEKKGFERTFLERVNEDERLVQVISYCIMPTHFHLVLKQLKKEGISKFTGDVSNSYSRYFNNKNNRKGTLWKGRFENIPVDSDEQLLHLTRYIHLNPTTAGLVENPEDWPYSSYETYISQEKDGICNYGNLLDINPKKYKEFVNARKDYQKSLAKIKKITLE